MVEIQDPFGLRRGVETSSRLIPRRRYPDYVPTRACPFGPESDTNRDCRGMPADHGPCHGMCVLLDINLNQGYPSPVQECREDHGPCHGMCMCHVLISFTDPP